MVYVSFILYFPQHRALYDDSRILFCVLFCQVVFSICRWNFQESFLTLILSISFDARQPAPNREVNLDAYAQIQWSLKSNERTLIPSDMSVDTNSLFFLLPFQSFKIEFKKKHSFNYGNKPMK